MAKPLGSITFGTDHIRTDEAVTMIKVIQKENPEVTPAEAMATIEFFDDCFSLMKVRSLSVSFQRTAKGNIRKNAAFSDLIARRLENYIQDVREIRGVNTLLEEEEVTHG